MRRPALRIGLLAVLAALLAPAARACSGPGAEAAVARAEVEGWVALGLAVLLAALTTGIGWSRGLRAHPMAAAWVLVLAHPALWLDARGGDCGRERVVGSALFTLAAVGLVAWARLRPLARAGDPGEG